MHQLPGSLQRGADDDTNLGQCGQEEPCRLFGSLTLYTYRYSLFAATGEPKGVDPSARPDRGIQSSPVQRPAGQRVSVKMS